jgi:AcrR family transcriptional regulator
VPASGPWRNVPPEIGARRSPPGCVLDHLKSQGDSYGSASLPGGAGERSFECNVTTRPTRERSARQRDILDAARELLAREGIEALTVGRLARSLGIKAPSLYKHFNSKRELETELIADGLEAHAAAVDGADLRAIARAYRDFALANPELYRLMTERPLPREDLPAGLEARAAAPLLRALGDADLARGAWAFAHGMVQLELAGRFPPDADLDAAWERVVEALTGASAESSCGAEPERSS